MKTILVTGVYGFIGSNFIYHILKNQDYSIIGLDCLSYAGNIENLLGLNEIEKERFTPIVGDITDATLVSKIFSDYPITGVINFAAETHVDRSIHDPGAFVKTNVYGTYVLLEEAKRCWYNNGVWEEGVKFLQVSTDEVYGSLGSTGLFSENTPLDPHSPYSATKAGADHLVKAYHDTYGMPVSITRCSNNYGPYQFPEKLIPLILRNALDHKPLPVYGDGLQVRDWLYVMDHCNAICCVFEKGLSGEVYNIGGNNEMENIRIVKIIIRILNEMTADPEINESLITYVTDRPGHDRRYAIDARKIHNALGWKPETKFEDGIRMTIQWYLNNKDWMKRIISGQYREWIEKNYEKR